MIFWYCGAASRPVFNIYSSFPRSRRTSSSLVFWKIHPALHGEQQVVFVVKFHQLLLVDRTRANDIAVVSVDDDVLVLILMSVCIDLTSFHRKLDAGNFLRPFTESSCHSTTSRTNLQNLGS